MNRKRIAGLIIVLSGFALILLNAISYVFHSGTTSPIKLIIGFDSVIIGNLLRKIKEENNQEFISPEEK